MIVIKVGGSFYGSKTLTDCINVISQHGAGQAVIVPGGGPFADQVRRSQQEHQFHDRIAHHMAINAMDQFGLYLIGIAEQQGLRLSAARTHKDIKQVLEQSMVPVWLPAQQLSRDNEIPQNWNSTSDTLAAWLSSTIEAKQLLLLKQMDGEITDNTFNHLASIGLVDSNFQRYADKAMFASRYLKSDHAAQLKKLLENDNHDAVYIS